MLGVHCCAGFSLVAESRATLAAVGRLFIVAAFLVEHKPLGVQASVAAVSGQRAQAQ